MVDPAWSDFRQDAFGDAYLVWHDGPDFSVFRETWARDPELTTRMLVAGIAAGDALAASATREIELTPAQRSHFVATLMAAERLKTGETRIAASRSLYSLTGDPSWAAPIVEELGGDAFWSVQLDAALAIRDFPPTPDLIAAVARAVAENPEYLVRYHAANTLLAWAGVAPEIEHEVGLFDALVSDNATSWAGVASALTARARNTLDGAA